ncbi:MAG TPA: ribonuclease HII [Anaerolineae bacterium]|nr:ribonuclease HII [Anaerolineae bacterium]HID84957.1 ribonuclease HII [Anaerolineales bacterium]HIQ08207.1 ribonuclease HII [Anaerolineaceae bacterium]
MTRRKPDLRLEGALWQGGLRHVAGVDEAGRGALAGPVAAAVVILPPDIEPDALDGVMDSKQLSSSRRQAAATLVRRIALAWAVGFASAREIDRWGILPATRLAVRRALRQLTVPPEYLLLDHLLLPEVELPQTAMPKGDALVLSIAAASVLAKTSRDALMEALEARYPGYGFAQHKGYGTAAHRAALRRLGPSPIHRRSFRLLAGE